MSNLSLSKKKVEVVKNDVEDNNSFHQVVMDHLVRKKEKLQKGKQESENEKSELADQVIRQFDESYSSANQHLKHFDPNPMLNFDQERLWYTVVGNKLIPPPPSPKLEEYMEKEENLGAKQGDGEEH